MAGVATAYGFMLWTMSYKSTRDNLNQRLREVEELYPDLFTITTIDTRYRGPVAKRSLSSYIIALQIVATVALLCIYVASLLRFAYF